MLCSDNSAAVIKLGQGTTPTDPSSASTKYRAQHADVGEILEKAHRTPSGVVAHRPR